jgi:hypothetical protein
MTSLGWFRQDNNCLSAPEVVRLARALRIPATHALGIITAIEAQLTAFSPKGDLRHVADMLSVWAQWEGDAEPFAIAFIKAVADDACCMRSWVERNEASQTAAEKNRLRQQKLRDKRRENKLVGREKPAKERALLTAPDNG